MKKPTRKPRVVVKTRGLGREAAKKVQKSIASAIERELRREDRQLRFAPPTFVKRPMPHGNPWGKVEVLGKVLYGPRGRGGRNR